MEYFIVQNTLSNRIYGLFSEDPDLYQNCVIKDNVLVLVVSCGVVLLVLFGAVFRLKYRVDRLENENHFMEGEVTRLRTITLELIDTVVTPEKEVESLTDLQIPSKSTLAMGESSDSGYGNHSISSLESLIRENESVTEFNVGQFERRMTKILQESELPTDLPPQLSVEEHTHSDDRIVLSSLANDSFTSHPSSERFSSHHSITKDQSRSSTPEDQSRSTTSEVHESYFDSLAPVRARRTSSATPSVRSYRSRKTSSVSEYQPDE